MSTDWEARVLAEIDATADDLLAFAGELIRTPSENPPGDCADVAALIAGHLRSGGVEPQVLDAGDGRVSVFCSASHGDGKRLVLSGHHDVVPVGDRSRWSFDPFAGDVVDGVLRGRGASDMKAGLAGIIHAYLLLQRLGVPYAGDLALLCVPDEETGGRRGADWALDEVLTGGADGAIIAEPAHRSAPTIGQKGSNWFRLTIHGKPGHGSIQPIHGVSANLLGARAVLALQQLWDMRATTPDDETEQLVETSAVWSRKREGYDAGIGEVFRRVTVNIGTVHGGTSPNVVADTCVIEVDTRVPIGLNRAEVLARVDELLAQAGVEATVEPIGFCSEPNWTLPSDPVVEATMSALRDVVDPQATPVLQWASSDARCFRSRGIPVLQYGPATLPTIHGLDKRCDAADVVAAAKVYALSALRFLGLTDGAPVTTTGPAGGKDA